MAKRKRHGGSAQSTAGSTATGAATGTANAAGSSRVRSGGYCARSSLGAPFLVISPEQLVSTVSPPGPQDWREVLELTGEVVKQWESRRAAVLADFEGSFTGFEGDPLLAVFQRSFALDPQSLRAMPTAGPCKDMGLLVDLRHEESAAVAKRIMESDSIVKVIWGADSDIISLRYTPLSRPLGIKSARLVDAQLGFSAPQKRLAMVKMLERLPPKSIQGLPLKTSVDFKGSHAFNRHALHVPLETHEAAYAMDDLHRLDAILRTQQPRGGNYIQAQSQTIAILSLILQRPELASAEKLHQLDSMFGMRTGLERQEIAVRIKRHLLAARRLLPQHFVEGGALGGFGGLEWEADTVLKESGVAVPVDLSFSSGGDPPAPPGGVPDVKEKEAPAAPETTEETKPAHAASDSSATQEGTKAEAPAALETTQETKSPQAVGDSNAAQEGTKAEAPAALETAQEMKPPQAVGDSNAAQEGTKADEHQEDLPAASKVVAGKGGRRKGKRKKATPSDDLHKRSRVSKPESVEQAEVAQEAENTGEAAEVDDHKQKQKAEQQEEELPAANDAEVAVATGCSIEGGKGKRQKGKRKKPTTSNDGVSKPESAVQAAAPIADAADTAAAEPPAGPSTEERLPKRRKKRASSAPEAATGKS